MTTPERPTSVQGGCLCGTVRYTVTFPPSFDFTTSSSTCQCIQCRKQTGSLYFPALSVPRSAVSFTGDPSRYYATPGIARGFCAACGSFLFWQNENEKEGTVEIAAGGFDREVMERYGALLAGARTHIYCVDAVPGVTDAFKGKRYKWSDTGDDVVLLGES